MRALGMKPKAQWKGRRRACTGYVFVSAMNFLSGSAAYSGDSDHPYWFYPITCST